MLRIGEQRPPYALSQVEDVHRQLLAECEKQFQGFKAQQQQLNDEFDRENGIEVKPPKSLSPTKKKKKEESASGGFSSR